MIDINDNPKKENGITTHGTIWFADYVVHGGWYHPFRDYIGNNFHGFEKDRDNNHCVWMVLK